MSSKRQRYETSGTSALKAPEGNFDVFVKPEFTANIEETPIISFKKAKGDSTYSSSDEFFDYIHEEEASRSMLGSTLDFLRNNKILGDLFTKDKTRNRYAKEDILIFTKGFTVTGFTALVLILFGV